MLELGAGLAAPSIVAAREGAAVVASDAVSDATVFAAHSLALNELAGEVAHADWTEHGEALVERGPFDLVLGADVLYTPANAKTLVALLPRLLAPWRRGADRRPRAGQRPRVHRGRPRALRRPREPGRRGHAVPAGPR